ncbi:unnamed protein product [Penicillium nalgiovense]|uniref:GATA-type domain-containing protein n=1 Tax=Penicillium nalgiovense TaxID=60175 RepID=A0A9W4HYR2_PENNA|nr:unnamed protein product [Penicillium nalgiovense]CAG8137383.1 unnamed protein product [Penicillium nalgiovense]CAG8139739.1 unnamed protein product [Penicillium nalgiovense]CAG8140618.1 unnamed protein product [Penicillium nalgiovense]CAG8142375.1 unnamed protein product [Penicillium nalgiovense]
MFLPKKHLKYVNHEGQGQMPRQWLPSIQEIFGETFPAIPPGPSYALPSHTRHAAPPPLPAVYEIDHSNEGAPSNEQGLLSRIPTVERPLGIISPINELQHPKVIHPENPSFPSNSCSLNERCRLSKHPELSISQPGSLTCDPIDLAKPSFAEPPNMFHEIPIRKIPNPIPPQPEQLCQPEKQTPSSLDFTLSFKVIETASARALALVRYHSAMSQSDNHQRSLPGPSITEINGLLSQEQQKVDALVHIRDGLVRSNHNQALAQQNTRASACMVDEADRGLCSSVTKQSKTHKVSKNKREWHEVSQTKPFLVSTVSVLLTQLKDNALRCHSCNRSETPEWRRGPDGSRTLCNACGLHYAKLSRRTGKFVVLDKIGARGKT